MAAYETSMDYEAIHIADVTQTFRSIAEKTPTTLSLVPISPVKATLHKHEWLEHKKVQLSWTVNGACNTGDTSLVVDSNVGMKVGDILKFEQSTGASVSVKAKVSAVNGDGVTVTIERLGTDENIGDNAIVYLVARPQLENSTDDNADNERPSRQYNYTQIFRRDFTLSRTILQSQVYGLATDADQNNKLMSLINFQVLNKLREIAWEFNQSLIDGIREERDDVTDRGMFGGILYFLNLDAASLYDAAGAAVSQTILNNAIQQASENGAITTDMTVLLCHPSQARAISAFNTSGNNPVIVRGDITAGNYVARYQSDLAGSNGGALTTIVCDHNFPKDQIAILNPSDLAIVPMENISVTETTDKKQDGRSWKILGELTVEIKNSSVDHVLIDNLELVA